MQWYNKHRPRKISDIVGQKKAIRIIEGYLSKEKMPQAFLFVGPSGTGKTTLARCLRKPLDCFKDDFWEINTADFRGIDTIRDIREVSNLHSKQKSRIILIDEAHQLSGDAQNALLKLLEDAPKDTYFILGTTRPQKLIREIKTRCTKIVFEPLADHEIKDVISRVAKKEGVNLSVKVISRIVESCLGCPREAINMLQSISGKTEAEQLACIADPETEEQAIALARLLIKPKAAPWKEVAEIIKNIQERGRDNQDAYSVLRINSHTRRRSPGSTSLLPPLCIRVPLLYPWESLISSGPATRYPRKIKRLWMRAIMNAIQKLQKDFRYEQYAEPIRN